MVKKRFVAAFHSYFVSVLKHFISTFIVCIELSFECNWCYFFVVVCVQHNLDQAALDHSMDSHAFLDGHSNVRRSDCTTATLKHFFRLWTVNSLDPCGISRESYMLNKTIILKFDFVWQYPNDLFQISNHLSINFTWKRITFPYWCVQSK